MPIVVNITKTSALRLMIRQLTCGLMIAVNMLIGTVGAHAGEISLAVASNFLAVEKELARAFEQKSGHDVITSSGSTGKLTTQIMQGAPFDIFMAADTVRPRKLIELGYAVDESFIIYATGRLALWSPTAESPEALKMMLLNKRYKHLALANPKTAPYGAAAIKVMDALKLGSIDQLVFGENITQSYQFVKTGNADLGFVALSQLQKEPVGSYWPVPDRLHQPLTQALVVIGDASKKEAVASFLEFLGSSEARSIITSYGYTVASGE